PRHARLHAHVPDRANTARVRTPRARGRSRRGRRLARRGFCLTRAITRGGWAARSTAGRRACVTGATLRPAAAAAAASAASAAAAAAAAD
ncbi:MAG: hypothetical protein AAFY81_01135, partial [Pseudomonadota bacterium]